MEMNHVLVVEDDKEIRQGIEIYLKSQGYEVYQAEDGIEGLEVIEKILSGLPQINSGWLLSGEGTMLKSGDSEDPYLITKSGIRYYQLPNGKFLMQVPFVPVKAYAKYVDECRDADLGEPMDEYNFIVDQIGHGKYMAFEIKGDSMDDDTRRSLANGDIILGRELNREYWKDVH